MNYLSAIKATAAKRLASLFPVRCYTTIDTLPVWWWYMVHNENDLSYIRKRRRDVTWWRRIVWRLQAEALERVWESLYDQYIKRFGFSAELLAIVRKQKEIAKLRLKMGLNGDRSQQTFIEIANAELQRMLDASKSEGDFFSSKPWIEKGMGFQIDLMTTPTAAYYGYIKVIEQMNAPDK